MRCKNDHAACCHTSRIPMCRPRCRRVHPRPLRVLCWRYGMRAPSALEQFSRSSFSLRLHRLAPPFHRILPESASLSKISARLLPTLFFWELVSALRSLLAWDSQSVCEQVLMSPSVSASAVGLRSSPRLGEVFHLPAHPISTALVRPEHLKCLPATARRSLLRPRHLRRHRSKRCFVHLRSSWLADSSGSTPSEGQYARVLSGLRFARSGRLSTSLFRFCSRGDAHLGDLRALQHVHQADQFLHGQFTIRPNHV